MQIDAEQLNELVKKRRIVKYEMLNSIPVLTQNELEEQLSKSGVAQLTLCDTIHNFIPIRKTGDNTDE